MSEGARLVVDWSLCDGNGLCAAEAPTLLAMDAHDELRQLRERIFDDERDAAARAVRACPKAALRLEA